MKQVTGPSSVLRGRWRGVFTWWRRGCGGWQARTGRRPGLGALGFFFGRGRGGCRYRKHTKPGRQARTRRRPDCAQQVRGARRRNCCQDKCTHGRGACRRARRTQGTTTTGGWGYTAGRGAAGRRTLRGATPTRRKGCCSWACSGPGGRVPRGKARPGRVVVLTCLWESQCDTRRAGGPNSGQAVRNSSAGGLPYKPEGGFGVLSRRFAWVRWRPPTAWLTAAGARRRAKTGVHGWRCGPGGTEGRQLPILSRGHCGCGGAGASAFSWETGPPAEG